MVEVKINAKPRMGTTSSYKHHLRNTGKIPGVIYGKDLPNKLVEMDVKSLESVLRTGAGRNAIINLTVQENTPRKYTVMIKDMQRDPVKGSLLHVDLQKISMQDKIHTVVPIHFIGDSVGVKKGGIMQATLRELDIECVPTKLPESIALDISALDIGDVLTVGNLLNAQDGYAIVNDPETVVVSIAAPRLAEEIETSPVEADTTAAKTESAAE